MMSPFDLLPRMLYRQGAGALLRTFYSRQEATEAERQDNVLRFINCETEDEVAGLRALVDIYLDRVPSESPFRAALELLADELDFRYCRLKQLWDPMLVKGITAAIGMVNPSLGIFLVAELLRSRPETAEMLATWTRSKRSRPPTPQHFVAFLLYLLNRLAPSQAAHVFDLGTTLVWAAGEGHEAVVRALLERFRTPCTTQLHETLKTPLHRAPQGGQLPIVEMLLATGQADVNAKDWRGTTPLHCAATSARNNKAVVEALLATSRVDVNIRINLGGTPLHAAAAFHRAVLARALLASGHVDVNARTDAGNTPLHYAAWYSEETAVAEALLAAGRVDLHAKNACGKTARDVALHQRRFATLGVFLRHSITRKMWSNSQSLQVCNQPGKF